MYAITKLIAALYPSLTKILYYFYTYYEVHDLCYLTVTMLSCNFFHSYAVIFYDHRIQEDMLPDLTKVC